SSSRWHTRSKRDWSSDVCSSDLHYTVRLSGQGAHQGRLRKQKFKIKLLNLAARWREHVKGGCPASDEECATSRHDNQRSKESEGRTNNGPPPDTHDESNDSEDVVKNCLRHTVYSIAVMTVAT